MPDDCLLIKWDINKIIYFHKYINKSQFKHEHSCVITPTCLDSEFRQVPSLSGNVHSEKGSGAIIIKFSQDRKLRALIEYSQHNLIVKVKATYHMIFDKCQNHQIPSRRASACTCQKSRQKRTCSCWHDPSNPLASC